MKEKDKIKEKYNDFIDSINYEWINKGMILFVFEDIDNFYKNVIKPNTRYIFNQINNDNSILIQVKYVKNEKDLQKIINSYEEMIESFKIKKFSYECFYLNKNETKYYKIFYDLYYEYKKELELV